VAATGYRNRFGHPAAEVEARYAQAGATLWRTDREGAVQLRLGQGGLQVQAERSRRPRYWHALAPPA